MYTKLSSTLTSFQGSGKQTYYKYPNMILIISSDEVAVNLVPLYMVGPRNLYIHILLGSTSLQPRIKNKNYIFFWTRYSLIFYLINNSFLDSLTPSLILFCPVGQLLSSRWLWISSFVVDFIVPREQSSFSVFQILREPLTVTHMNLYTQITNLIKT